MTLRSRAALPVALGVLVLTSVWAVGQGPGALLFPFVYAALVLPGLPLGFALFGSRHPAGWIAGAILGYALAALGIWAAAAIGMAGRRGFAAAIGLITLAAVAACWRYPQDAARHAASMDRRDRFRLCGCRGIDVGPRGTTTRQRRRAGPRRQPAIPCLLHRRLRVAHRADRGIDPIHPAPGKSLSRPGANSLLLGLLPRSRSDCAKRAGAVARRRALPATDCAGHRPAPDVVDLRPCIHRRAPPRRGGGRNRTRAHRVEPRGTLRALAAVAFAQAARTGPGRERRCLDRLGFLRPPDRRPAALPLVRPSALDGVRAGAGGAHDGHGSRCRSLAPGDCDRRHRARRRDADQSVRRRNLQHRLGPGDRDRRAAQTPARALAPGDPGSRRRAGRAGRGVVHRKSHGRGCWRRARVRAPRRLSAFPVPHTAAVLRSGSDSGRRGHRLGASGTSVAGRACRCPRGALAVPHVLRPAERRSRVDPVPGRPDAARGARGDGRRLVHRAASGR